MHRELIVETEPVATVTDFDRTAVVLEPAGLRWVGGGGGRRDIHVRRVQRVLREHVLDVHEQQLLVLLLMVQTEGDQFGETRLVELIEQRSHRPIDVGAVTGDLLDAGPRQLAPIGTRMAGPDRLVYG